MLVRFLFIPLFLLMSNHLFSAPKISLITCSAGDEIYSIFGHSAIRIQDSTTNTDVVYNYGMFSYNTDNFLYKFVKGETYYWLGKESYRRFIYSYKIDKRAVFENELNITPQDANKIQQYLENNVKPENAVYLYSYMFDNCATRIRDVFEKNIGDSVIWKVKTKTYKPMPIGIGQPEIFANFYSNSSAFTYRDLLNVYLEKIPWVNWGIYFSVAAPSDKTIPYIDAMFLPEFLMMECNNASYFKSGKQFDLLKKAKTLVAPESESTPDQSTFGPTSIFIIILLLIAAISYIGYRKNRWFWGIDSLIFTLTGLYGSAGAFVSWVSLHPATFPNYNMLWANPFQLLWAIFILIPFFRNTITKKVYLAFSACLALYFLAAVLSLQAVHWANIPFIGIIAVRMLLFLINKKMNPVGLNEVKLT